MDVEDKSSKKNEKKMGGLCMDQDLAEHACTGVHRLRLSNN
jgi:hypothetical protein